ncbi:glutamate receptor ionotropic, kainate glr-3-like [Oratosquilla oratoria]|uniref:glutamate receptor ionotropic, kainate glr-3-like n=1 Tax=Oratosquilla oratoria TaxID=337810 RepID=UPI003F770843
MLKVGMNGTENALKTGRCLKITYGDFPPFCQTVGDNIVGIAANILKFVTQQNNFCYDPPDFDMKWGSKEDNGSWTGMMGKLARKEVDVALGPFGVTWDRYQVADFSKVVHVTEHFIVYTRPGFESDMAGFIKPFPLLVWGLLGLTLIVMIWALFGASKSYRGVCSAKEQLGRKRTSPEGEMTVKTFDDVTSSEVIKDSVFWVLQIFSAQGANSSWVATSGRSGTPLVILWMLFCFLVGSMYKSNLMAMLILPKVNIPFNNLAEMVAQDKVKWGLPGHSIQTTKYKEADPSSVFGQVWARKEITATTIQQGTAYMDRGNRAVPCNSVTALLFLQVFFQRTGRCYLAVARERFLPITFAMAFPKESPYVQKFDKVILNLREFGLIDYWYHQTFKEGSRCFHMPPHKNLEANTLRPLLMEDLYGILSLYVAGMALAALSLVGEVLLTAARKRRTMGGAKSGPTQQRADQRPHGPASLVAN